MSIQTNNISKSVKEKYDLFMLALPIWAFFWALVSNFSFGSGSGSLIVGSLGIISIIALNKRKKVDKFLFTKWIYFFVMLLSRIPGSNTNTVLLDGTMCFAGWLICACINNADIRPVKLLKFVFRLGILVAIMMLVDMGTGLFSDILFGYYNEVSQLVKHRVTHGIPSRSAGIFAFSVTNGCFLICGMGAGIFLHRMKIIKDMWWNLAFVLYAVMLLYISKRGFMLDLAIVFLFFKSIDYYLKPREVVFSAKRLLSICAVVLSLCILYSSSDFVSNSVDSLLLRFSTISDGDDTLSGRLPLYQLAIDQFAEHPIRGIGWGNYRALTEGYLNQRSTYETHNVYLQLMSETGILGIVTFLYAILGVLFKTVLHYNNSIMQNRSEMECIYGFSLFMQLFFITYCISGNPLYDYHFLLMYFSGVALMNYKSKQYDI